MTGDFTTNIKRLNDETPRKVTGRVVVDQVYAHYQHEHPEFHHPDGGEAFYLQRPLFQRAGRYFKRLGAEAVHGRLKEAMTKNMEDLSQQVYDKAPWEFADLRASGHPSVDTDGHRVYDRRPMVGRLSKADLKIKSHLRYLFEPHRYGRR